MPKPSAEFLAQLLADPARTECPVCGEKGFYDNRGSGKKGPALKCKNKNCDTGQGFAFGVFARDLPASAQPAPNGAPGKPHATWKQLQKAYDECVTLALHEAGKIGKTGVQMNGEHIAAMAATLMITSDKTNCWPTMVAPTPPPPPPPPPPEDDGSYDNDSDLPF